MVKGRHPKKASSNLLMGEEKIHVEEDALKEKIAKRNQRDRVAAVRTPCQKGKPA